MPAISFHLPRRADADERGLESAARGVERRHLQKIVQATGGNMERAARTLGISASPLRPHEEVPDPTVDRRVDVQNRTVPIDPP
jgi:hypothetical protein